MISSSSSNPEPFGLLRIDVDHFKKVNDEHGGHSVRDEALIGIAAIANACVRSKGTAYRIGGDEFAVLLPNHTVDEATVVAERLRRTVNQTPLTSRELTLSVSVGVAVFPDHGGDIEAIGEAADRASYDAKNLGRNLVRIFREPPPTSSPKTQAIDRREPEPGTLTQAQKDRIRADYFRRGRAECPLDDAILECTDVTSFEDKVSRLWVRCPLCGVSEKVP